MDGRMKEVHRLMRTAGRLTDGQASVDLTNIDWDNDGFESFMLIIRPNGGYYKGGIFEFKVTLPLDFPGCSPPEIWCKTKIYHPNIDMDEESYFDESSTNVCLNLFDYGTWQPSFTLEVMVLGLVFLFDHPNLQDPLADGFSGIETEEEFAENVRKYMAGEDVNGVTYDTTFCVVNGIEVVKEPQRESKPDTNIPGETSFSTNTTDETELDANDNHLLTHSGEGKSVVELIDEFVLKNLICEPSEQIGNCDNKTECLMADGVQDMHTNDAHASDCEQTNTDIDLNDCTNSVIKRDHLNITIDDTHFEYPLQTSEPISRYTCSSEPETCTKDTLENSLTPRDEQVEICVPGLVKDNGMVINNGSTSFSDVGNMDDGATVEFVYLNGDYIIKPKSVYIREKSSGFCSCLRHVWSVVLRVFRRRN